MGTNKKSMPKTERQEAIESAFRKKPGDLADEVDPIADKLEKLKSHHKLLNKVDLKTDSNSDHRKIICIGNVDSRETPTRMKHVAIRIDYLDWFKNNVKGKGNDTLIINEALRFYMQHCEVELENEDITIFNSF